MSEVPASRRFEATPRPRVGCPPPSAAGLIMMVKHEVHGQNELCCPVFLASGSPPGQEERLVTSPEDEMKMPGLGRAQMGRGQAPPNRTPTGPHPLSHPREIRPFRHQIGPITGRAPARLSWTSAGLKSALARR